MAQDFVGIGNKTADVVARLLNGETIKEPVICVPTKLVTAANASEQAVAGNIVLGRRYPKRLGVAVNWAELNRRARAATLCDGRADGGADRG
ncbi:MAG: hypothetical protein ACC619_02310 [Paracoccaceae bacterium]